ncbi:MAG: DUF4260 domain-containing protein [Halobacteria archaeon]|nr:DUF4260 domain-containing protein [Halobacteria archaeon]
MEPRYFLRLEGLVALVGALAVYFALDGSIWLLVVLALAPDLSMVGYLAGPRVGSVAYNVVHTYALPLVLAGAGFYFGVTLAVQISAIWAGHIGIDRFFGYGLKYPSGFKDTHLSKQPAPISAFVESD